VVKRFQKLWGIRNWQLVLAIICIGGGVGLAILPGDSRVGTVAHKATATPTQKLAASSPTPTPVDTTTSKPEVAGATTTNTTPSVQPSPQDVIAMPENNNGVHFTLIEPDGTFNWVVGLGSGTTACDVLTEAKAEGKLRSVTMSYYSSFHSYYIEEINNYHNNWTFSVNGKAPPGCSLVTVGQGDNVTWRFR
jgi:hypothetical protein